MTCSRKKKKEEDYQSTTDKKLKFATIPLLVSMEQDAEKSR